MRDGYKRRGGEKQGDLTPRSPRPQRKSEAPRFRCLFSFAPLTPPLSSGFSLARVILGLRPAPRGAPPCLSQGHPTPYSRTPANYHRNVL